MIKYNLYNLYSNAEYIGMSVISLEIKICHTQYLELGSGVNNV